MNGRSIIGRWLVCILSAATLGFGLAQEATLASNLPDSLAESRDPAGDQVRGRRAETSAAAEVALSVGNVIVIPPAAFVADGLAPDTHFSSFADGHIQGTGGYGCLLAPIILPPGTSSLERVFVFAHDDNPGDSVTFSVRRISFRNGTSTRLGTVQTRNTTGVVKYEIPLRSSTVSNNLAFQITTCLNSPDIFLYGARVHIR